MIINTLYDVSIIIGGADLLNDGNASQVNCTIEESIYDGIPMCHIMFLSSPDFLNNNPIVDGTAITIKISSEQLGIRQYMFFRVLKVSVAPNGNNMFYSINGIIDFYEFFRDPIVYSMNSNSSEIFKRIADVQGLNCVIHPTKDKQLWIPSESNLYQWLNYVTQHAWASPQSGFFWFLTKEKDLLLLDIDRLVYGAKNVSYFKYGDLQTSDITNNISRYKNIAINISTGNENIFNRGYDGDNEHFDLLSYSTKHVKANKVRAVSEIVNINKGLSAGLGKNILPFDVGNHHPNFFLAEAQNRRVLSTYSTYIDLTCEFYTPIDLAQVYLVDATPPNASTSVLKVMNIKYVVSKIITKITSSSVNMEVELCSQGYNGKSNESY